MVTRGFSLIIIVLLLAIAVHFSVLKPQETIVRIMTPATACVETRLPIQHNATMVICGKTVSDDT